MSLVMCISLPFFGEDNQSSVYQWDSYKDPNFFNRVKELYNISTFEKGEKLNLDLYEVLDEIMKISFNESSYFTYAQKEEWNDNQLMDVTGWSLLWDEASGSSLFRYNNHFNDYWIFKDGKIYINYGFWNVEPTLLSESWKYSRIQTLKIESVLKYIRDSITDDATINSIGDSEYILVEFEPESSNPFIAINKDDSIYLKSKFIYSKHTNKLVYFYFGSLDNNGFSTPYWQLFWNYGCRIRIDNPQ